MFWGLGYRAFVCASCVFLSRALWVEELEYDAHACMMGRVAGSPLLSAAITDDLTPIMTRNFPLFLFAAAGHYFY